MVKLRKFLYVVILLVNLTRSQRPLAKNACRQESPLKWHNEVKHSMLSTNLTIAYSQFTLLVLALWQKSRTIRYFPSLW